MAKPDKDSAVVSHKTPPPLHVVGPDDTGPPVDDSQEFPVQEAITRKVLNPLANPLATPALASPNLRVSKRSAALLNSKSRLFLIAAGISVGVVVGIVVLWNLGRKSAAPAPPAPMAIPQTVPPTPPPVAVAVPTAAPIPTLPPSKALAPETSRIQITVHPAEATLTLDDGIVDGARLEANVQRDHILHVVRASAPGYIPFKKIISFSNDVRLDIDLQKEPSSTRASVKRRAPQAGARAKGSEVKNDATPKQVEEFGMTLDRPAARRASKKIDEKDPYAQ